MVFSSIIFLFLFLPVVLLLYYLVFLPARLGRRVFGVKLGNLLLLASSLFFYAWGEQWFVLVMISSIGIDYLSGLAISGGWKNRGAPIEALDKETPRTRLQKTALVASICANLSILGFFKYFNFGMDNVNALADALGLDWLQWKDVFEVSLPLGISFYTFQSLSYTIDVYRGETRATRNLLAFACFVTLFPQLVAGPIVRYRDVAAQLVRRVVTRESFTSGVTRFTLGLGKKVLVANTVAYAADRIFEIPDAHLTPGLAWLGVACYTLQIYFDFSGYSDMAIGLGRMFGFDFLENFNYPYISQSIQEFWRRWHMSLSRWFRDYLYIPLGGSQRGSKRTYLNLVIVFFLCGLWHGASWTFVIWGFYHGFFLVLERLGLKSMLDRCWAAVRHLYVLPVVMVGWVLFRAETFSQALAFISAMAGFAEGAGRVHYVALYVTRDLIVALVAGSVLSMPIIPWIVGRYQQSLAAPERGGALALCLAGNAARLLALTAILVACVLSLSSGTHNPFIYFRF